MTPTQIAELQQAAAKEERIKIAESILRVALTIQEDSYKKNKDAGLVVGTILELTRRVLAGDFSQ